MAQRTIRVQDEQTLPFLMIPKALFHFGLTPKALNAYIALKYYANRQSNACEGISQITMGKLVNVSEDTMKRGLRELIRKGLVKKTARSKRSSKGERIPMPNLYTILNLAIEDDPI
jgi:hypothetical protein